MFISVDLPDPEVPMMATISPASMVRSIPCSTVSVSSPTGNSRRMPFSSISGAMVRTASAHRSGHRRAGPAGRLPQAARFGR